MTWTSAVKLMQLGFRVFPLRGWFNHERNKWVKIPLTENGFKDAITDPSLAPEAWKTAEWWGIVHDDMTIIDADGAEGVATLNAALPFLPPASVVVQTVSGGIHWYTPGTAEIGTRKPRYAPGLDVLTGNDKGFVVAPPSPGYEIISGSFEQLAEDVKRGLAGETQDS